MASATVSYGIGVQNRYSAFLEDEDALALGFTAALAPRHKQQQHNRAQLAQHSKTNKTQGGGGNLSAVKPTHGVKASSIKPNQSAPARSNQDTTTRHASDHQSILKKTSSAQDFKQSARLQQPRTHGGTSSRQNQHSRPNGNHESNAYNQHKSSRSSYPTNPANQHPQQQQLDHHADTVNSTKAIHLTQQSGVNQHGKTGHTNLTGNRGGYFQRPTQRRQYNHSHDERRLTAATDDNPSISLNGTSLEEEKRRRQQKRNLDLKHKDPEKREARRQQAALQAQSGIRVSNNEDRHQESTQQEFPFKGSRSRRPINGELAPNRNQESENSTRGNRSANGLLGGKNRGFRDVENGVGDQRRDKASYHAESLTDRHQAVAGSERVPRDKGKNNYGLNPRGSRFPKNDAQGRFNRTEVDRHKPIPNFSDKLDFPSLAS